MDGRYTMAFRFARPYHIASGLKGATKMAGRSRLWTVMLAVMILFVAVAAGGCAVGRNPFTRMADGGMKYTEGDDVWVWDRAGGIVQITLNDKLFAVLQRGSARISLPDGRTLDVLLDGNGEPMSAKVSWGVALSQQDYTQMNTAFYVNRTAGGQKVDGTAGWVILSLLLIVAGVLIFFYSGSLVNSAKRGGIFSGFDTARSLLIFRAAGILMTVIGLIILLVVIF